MKRTTHYPTEDEIARSQANIAAVLGPSEVEKMRADAEEFDRLELERRDELLGDPPASADPSPPLDPPLSDWEPMETARKDGKPLWLRGPDGETVEATWRQSRRIVNTPKGYAWETYFTWTAINSGGLVMWEPVGWRPTTGAPHP